MGGQPTTYQPLFYGAACSIFPTTSFLDLKWVKQVLLFWFKAYCQINTAPVVINCQTKLTSLFLAKTSVFSFYDFVQGQLISQSHRQQCRRTRDSRHHSTVSLLAFRSLLSHGRTLKIMPSALQGGLRF